VTQAETGITQVEKQIAASEKSLDLIDLNIEKLLVSAPVSGTLRTRSIEPGEILQAGISALVIDRLDQLTVTVYFPEDRYGQIKLGDVAEITVDSYPGETFEAEVIRISDRAEYTPRNVQTAEDRVTTVYAIELAVDDYDGKLKPGMPLDATFAD
jgi:multidrug resistance efflux pump